jgi:hypothetical protein
MVTILSLSLQLSSTFPLASSPPKPHAPKHSLSFTTPTTDPQTPPFKLEPDPSEPESNSNADFFENRLTQVRLRYRSGTGKKAEFQSLRRWVFSSF